MGKLYYMMIYERGLGSMTEEEKAEAFLNDIGSMTEEEKAKARALGGATTGKKREVPSVPSIKPS